MIQSTQGRPTFNPRQKTVPKFRVEWVGGGGGGGGGRFTFAPETLLWVKYTESVNNRHFGN